MLNQMTTWTIKIKLTFVLHGTMLEYFNSNIISYPFHWLVWLYWLSQIKWPLTGTWWQSLWNILNKNTLMDNVQEVSNYNNNLKLNNNEHFQILKFWNIIHSLTHSLMELSPSWQAANCAAMQEINPAF
jgi:hypothetical protein